MPKGFMGYMTENDYAFKGVYLVNTEYSSTTEDCSSTMISGYHYGVFGIIEQAELDLIIGRLKDDDSISDNDFDRDLFRFSHSSLGFI